MSDYDTHILRIPVLTRPHCDAVARVLRYCAQAGGMTYSSEDADRDILAITDRPYKDSAHFTPDRKTIELAEQAIKFKLKRERGALLIAGTTNILRWSKPGMQVLYLTPDLPSDDYTPIT